MRGHEQDTDHLCALCGETCRGKRAYELHMMMVHRGETPHECEICHDKFTSLAALRRYVYHGASHKIFVHLLIIYFIDGSVNRYATKSGVNTMKA